MLKFNGVEKAYSNFADCTIFAEVGTNISLNCGRPGAVVKTTVVCRSSILQAANLNVFCFVEFFLLLHLLCEVLKPPIGSYTCTK